MTETGLSSADSLRTQLSRQALVEAEARTWRYTLVSHGGGGTPSAGVALGTLAEN